MIKKLSIFMFIIPIILMAELNVKQVNSALLSIQSDKPLRFFSKQEEPLGIKQLPLTSFENANIILFPEELNLERMNIVSSYKELQLNKNSIGAIYLKKGRTQIIFVEERLKNNGLSLPKSFKKNILNECQLNPQCMIQSL